MSSLTTAADRPPPPVAAVPRGMTLLLATACGLLVANLYYSQPLAGPIGASLGLSHAGAGLIVTMTQLGYGIGLLFIVPLADLTENRRLVIGVSVLAALSLFGAALSPSAGTFLAAALMIGITSVAVQILVPFAAHLAPEAERGQVVGNVMSGLMLGIMLSRPAASFVAEASSWHAVFYASSIITVAVLVVLARALPKREPTHRSNYRTLLASMFVLARTQPVLRRRAVYQFCMFGSFSLFWTTTPLLLAGPLYGLSQAGIALFALAGVAGAVSAPLAGRLADLGHTRVGSGCALALAGASYGLARLAVPGSTLALGLLVASAIVLDFSVTASLVFGQRAIFGLGADIRGRLNALFMAFFFLGGAVGSAAGGWAFAVGGWPLTSAVGAALPVLALIFYAGEWFGRWAAT